MSPLLGLTRLSKVHCHWISATVQDGLKCDRSQSYITWADLKERSALIYVLSCQQNSMKSQNQQWPMSQSSNIYYEHMNEPMLHCHKFFIAMSTHTHTHALRWVLTKMLSKVQTFYMFATCAVNLALSCTIWLMSAKTFTDQGFCDCWAWCSLEVKHYVWVVFLKIKVLSVSQ